MVYLMHRDFVMRTWGPLSCHSSAAISSWFSIIMQCPMSQRSVHNPCKIKMSQFFYGLHTYQTYTHWACLGCSGSTCTTACFSVPAISHSHWRGVGQHSTGQNQQPDQLYAKEMCCATWGKWSHQILTGFLKVSVTCVCLSVIPVMWNP
jgi:hypothetical protein